MQATLLLWFALGIQDAQSQTAFDALTPKTYNIFVSQLLSAISNKDVQKELEIVADQINEIKERTSIASKKYNEALVLAQKLATEGSNPERARNAMQAAVRDYVSEVNAVLADVLLPHQQKELNRTIVWWMVKSDRRPRALTEHFGFRTVLTHPVVSEMIELDRSQLQKVEEHANELQTEYAKELAALHEKYEKRLRESLPRDQQKKAKNLLGKTPEYYFSLPRN